jgi:AcrR family transcriptional regulator
LEVRPPRQRRSREAWARVLDAGTALLEEGGYEAFTIAAVCERAGVAPRALYERVDTKDALFLAVYEHGMARIRVENAVFDDDARWAGLTAQEVAERAVGVVVDVFGRHAALLRAVVLISGAHPEVNRRGGVYSRELGAAFARRIARSCPAPPAAIEAAYTAVFSTMVVRVAYGPTFAAPSVDDDTLVDALRTMVRTYLFDDRGR